MALVMGDRSNHAADQTRSRLAAHARGGVNSRADAWAHPGGQRRKMCQCECGGPGASGAWPAGVLGQGLACVRITQIAKWNAKG